jgi:predicted Zn-dependent protease
MNPERKDGLSVWLKLLITLGLFLSIWLLISQINFTSWIPKDEINLKTEKKLGELLEDFIKATKREIEDKEVRQKLDSLIDRLVEPNGLKISSNDVYLIKSNEINALAIPGNKILILSGLIEACESEMELAGVLAHEMAHHELGHVRKKLTKQVGVAMVSTALSGGGVEVAGVIFELLAGSAYDRSLEKEADMKAIEYLQNAQLDPHGLSSFLSRLDEDLPGFEYLEWLKTHPNTTNRIAYLEEALASVEPRIESVLGEEGWYLFKEKLRGYK